MFPWLWPLAASWAAFATALADLATPLTSWPTFRSFAFAIAPHPAGCWRAAMTWLSAVSKGIFDCWLMAKAMRSATRISPQPHPVRVR